MAEGNESTNAAQDQPAKASKTIVAEWVGMEGHQRVDGVSIREMSKKDVKAGLVMDIPKDLRWGPESNYRVDLTDYPDNFVEYLRKQSEFKITEE